VTCRRERLPTGLETRQDQRRRWVYVCASREQTRCLLRLTHRSVWQLFCTLWCNHTGTLLPGTVGAWEDKQGGLKSRWTSATRERLPRHFSQLQHTGVAIRRELMLEELPRAGEGRGGCALRLLISKKRRVSYVPACSRSLAHIHRRIPDVRSEANKWASRPDPAAP
jgi:hypothetical protein